jgi:hypothetical protein
MDSDFFHIGHYSCNRVYWTGIIGPSEKYGVMMLTGGRFLVSVSHYSGETGNRKRETENVLSGKDDWGRFPLGNSIIFGVRISQHERILIGMIRRNANGFLY